MIRLTLPDGASREFDAPLDGMAFAKSISNSLAKKALALKVDGDLVDLATLLDKDCEVAVITASDDEGSRLFAMMQRILWQRRCRSYFLARK